MKALEKQEVALEVLRSKCQEVESSDEAEVIVGLLESILENYNGKYISLSAPETNVLKKIAIIRTSDVLLDLINPKIVEVSEKVIFFEEPCISFNYSLNCMRHESIIIENGFNGELIQLKGRVAHIAQHEIDHLNGVLFQDKRIKLAIVRPDGKIYARDFCPCGNKKKYNMCCQRMNVKN